MKKQEPDLNPIEKSAASPDNKGTPAATPVDDVAKSTLAPSASKKDIKDNPIMAAVILFIIALFVTAALASANELTKDTIAAQAKIDQDNARLAVFPSAASFEEVSPDYITADTPKIKTAYKAMDPSGKILGLVILSSSRGYAGDVSIMSGISLEKKVLGIQVIAENETPGLGKKVAEKSFISRFLSKTPGLLFSVKKIDKDINYVDAITGATISSKAMVDATNSALDFATLFYSKLQLKGGK